MKHDDWGLGPTDDDLSDLTGMDEETPRRTPRRRTGRKRGTPQPQPTAFSSTVLTGFIIIALTVMVTLLLPQHTPLKIPGAWLATLNVIAFLTCGLDKRLAIKHRFRIPGNVILLLAIAGGALGTLLSLIGFHHKVRRGHFFIKIAAILVVQIMAIYFALYFQIITVNQALAYLVK